MMFSAVLVANRGEIATRIIRTLRGLGITPVAICTDADSDARHVREADLALRVGSYRSVEDVVAAALAAGAPAVHPGYGFLAEDPALARSCAEHGLVFVGPPAAAIAAMGDKIAAKAAVAAAGVPVVPGSTKQGLTDEELTRAALDAGLGSGAAVLLKPSAGGGGRGMRRVQAPGELAGAIEAARREARAAFGDDTLLVERYVDHPRHIEIQVFADTHGGIVHLGERECSLQRRHQKIIEEAPSPLLAGPGGQRTRAAMGAAAVAAARAVGYVGAGTVEYIVSADRPDEYFFMEMNTRLQVEHPVTEMAVTVTGHPALDLVELQLRVAAGQPLPFGQEDVAFAGHAIEARICAEDPARQFLPTGGTVLLLDEPSDPDVRVDSGLAEGQTIGGAYDPMLAKVIARGPDRPAALRRLDRALGDYLLLGVVTNVAFLRSLLTDPDVAAGQLDTGLAERRASGWTAPPVPGAALAAAALDRLVAPDPATGSPRTDASPPDTGSRPRDPGPWAIPDGWRLGEHAWTTCRLGGHEVAVRGPVAAAEASIDGGDPRPAAIGPGHRELAGPELAGRELTVSYAGRITHFGYARDGATRWFGRDGSAWAVTESAPASTRSAGATATAGLVRSPMPGSVLAVKAAAGDRVETGQPLVVVEAMKMEHVVVAPVGGVLTELTVGPGAQVGVDEVLAVISLTDPALTETAPTETAPTETSPTETAPTGGA